MPPYIYAKTARPLSAMTTTSSSPQNRDTLLSITDVDHFDELNLTMSLETLQTSGSRSLNTISLLKDAR